MVAELALLSSQSRQVDSPARQVTFHFHLPKGQEPRQVIRQLNKKSKLRFVQGKQNLSLKVKLEFEFFLSLGSIRCHTKHYPTFCVKVGG